LKSLAKILTLALALLASFPAAAQYKREKDATIPLEHFYIERHKVGPFRYLLSKVHISLSTGYGNTIFKHELDSFGIVQQPDSVPLIFNGNSGFPVPAVNHINWFNRTSQPPYTNVAPGSFLVNGDTTDLGFRSKAFTIPIKATLHVELFNRYRIGGGYSYEFTHLRNFIPTNYDKQISSFSPEANNFFMKKYFGMIGGAVYRYYEYLLVADLNIGGYKLGREFDMAVIRKGVYYNLGVAVEREFSEYFRVFVRPSYELKKYRLTFPEGGDEIVHRMNGWFVNVGATYRLPELRRCPLKDCHAQLNHAHGNKEYRSRRHPIWKKQNPHYGENYPNLIKYKGKNKYKLNPY
jgi:hypothetical protein